MKKMFYVVDEYSRKLAKGGSSMLKKVAAPAVGAGVLLATNAAMATGTDYSALTTAADWSSVATGVITVFAAGATVIVAFVGGKFLLKALRGA